MNHRRRRVYWLSLNSLERRDCPIANLTIDSGPLNQFPQYELVDPNPNSGGQFGYAVVPLPSGNIVVTDPFDNAGGDAAGAVYLFNGTTGQLISTIHGSHTNDRVSRGGITLLTNGSFVISSPEWNDGTSLRVGAVTFVNGVTGLSGTVSPMNSLVGSHQDDQVGIDGIRNLPTGNAVILSSEWNNQAGAVTFMNGQSGITGPIDATNSLVGSTSGDQVGTSFSNTFVVLSNGNYVVGSRKWDNGPIPDAGAVTWGNGISGISGPITEFNSLVGSHASDSVGLVTALADGHYVVLSSFWDNGSIVDTGAVTYADGTVGIHGTISSLNSLIGRDAGDGIDHVIPLSNGNYVVTCQGWDSDGAVDVGAVTLCRPADGFVSGVISSTNSLVGTHAQDLIGRFVIPLANGNYVVESPFWDNGTKTDSGAVTWVNGITGLTGPITPANSLVGTSSNDQVGHVQALKNGNYVVTSTGWTNPSNGGNGAVTFGNGTIGVTGPITLANSLIGTTGSNHIGNDAGITELVNGNYVVSSPRWDDGNTIRMGAVTWGNGTTGVAGTISQSNSLVGSSIDDGVGQAIIPLANGNFVVSSPGWGFGGLRNLGAVTFTDGTKGIAGAVTPANSLVGLKQFDSIGSSVFATSNGNYVILSSRWNNDAITEAGAITFANGTTGIAGSVTASNSIVGSHVNDSVGSGSILELADGHVVIFSPLWDSNSTTDVGAATVLDGKTGQLIDGRIADVVTQENSIVGQSNLSGLRFPDRLPESGTVLVSYPTEGNHGHVRVGILNSTLLAGDRALGQKVYATPSIIEQYLSKGQTLVLQSEDILQIVDSIVVDNPSGNGGALTLNAGNTLSLFASIQTDQADLNLLAQTVEFATGIIIETGSGTLKLPSGKAIFHQGLLIDGRVDLNGAVLSRDTPSVNSLGNRIPVIENRSRQSTVGSFANFPPGSKTTVNGISYHINYTSGDGNDVAFERDVPLPANLLGEASFSVGSDALLNAYDHNGTAQFTLNPFINFSGGLRTAAADFTGDGVADFVVGTGPGSSTHVKIFDGVSKAELFSIDPFEAAFTGGIFVAAGDINGDGKADLAITPDEGGGPRCRVFDGNGFVQLADFFGIDDPNFRGGARAAIGDMNGDGKGDLQIVAGFGGGPRVAAFDGSKLTSNGGPKLFGDFFAFEQSLRNGIFVASGDVNGDGYADLIAGGGPGGGPRVFILDGKSLVQTGSDKLVPIGNFFAGDVNSRGGIRVTVKDLDGDNKADVVVGSGANAGSRVSAYLGKDTTPLGGTPATTLDFEAFAGFSGGVFVG